MDPPLRRPRIHERVSLPGVAAPYDWSPRNRSIQLTYSTHIPKKEYEKWFREVIMPAYCSGGKLIFIRLAHETEDIINPYYHTHVVVQTKTPIRTRDKLALDWKKLPDEPYSDSHIHPSVRLLITAPQVEEAIHYLADEDEDNILFRNAYSYPEKIPEKKVQEPIQQPICFPLPNCPRPKYRVQHLLNWQADVLNIIEDNSSLTIPLSPDDVVSKFTDNSQIIDEIHPSRIVNIVYDPNGQSGKLTFFKAIKNSQPERFIIIQGIPDGYTLARFIGKAKRSGWIDDTIIINTRYQENSQDLDNNIQDIVGIANASECCNLWIFTNVIPSLSTIALERWKFYKISADWPRRVVSHLNYMSLEEASAERIRQERYILECSALPRRQYA